MSKRDYKDRDACVKFRCKKCGKKYMDECYWIVSEFPISPKTTQVRSIHGVCKLCFEERKKLKVKKLLKRIE